MEEKKDGHMCLDIPIFDNIFLVLYSEFNFSVSNFV